MATYLSGNDGTITGPDFNGVVTRFQVRDSALLPATGAMGEDRDGFVVGPLGPAIATIDFLIDTAGTFTDANYEPGTLVSLVLQTSAVTGNLKISANATLQDLSFDTDRRGVTRGTGTFKLKSDYALAEVPA